MEYEDRLTISTPEGVELELTLAGLGSRTIAGLIDLLLKALVIAALAVALGFALRGAAGLSGDVAAAILAPLSFIAYIGYDVLFETRGGGRTPGKRLAGLRVVRAGGQPIGFLASAVRNAIRLIDGVPLMYVPGMISILATRRNQRLGDLAAGTVVIRDRVGGRSDGPLAPTLPALDEQAAVWDVSGVTAEEIAAVRRFLERRDDLTSEARGDLAVQLADRLRTKVPGAPEGDAAEDFLERLAAAKAARG